MVSSPDTENERRRRKSALAFFALIQAAAAVYFIADAMGDLMAGQAVAATWAEALIALGLGIGAAFGVREMRRAHVLLMHHEEALATASGALAEVIEAQFADWRLTPAEREVGMFALKGFDLNEIARLRGAAPGTVRAQMASIYAKSGTSGRAQFAAFFVEDLLAGGVNGMAAEGAAGPADPGAAAE
ncbi:helix-turn-helix transcriptional regulator [Acidimangrovimonas sediminis]|uniref:helix-turn-helix transcriptional regulator n=1 Tax=Acidimangrovimonas sediminis TaxID=2056283 RepID=UPI000C7FE1A6|nr:LuxR family transcriptional regulator [Acidimangrovimonas sediminis]